MGKNKYGFDTGEFDPDYDLVIDPVVLVFSTYLGGDREDNGMGITLNSSGNAYVIGTTYSFDFPTLNPFMTDPSPNLNDAFVTKFSPNGQNLIFSTYLGGSGSYTNVTSDQTSQDYTATLLTYLISGVIKEGSTGLPNVILNGLPGNPSTNGTGNYSVLVDFGWSGVSVPALSGYTFSPESRSYVNVTANQTLQDFSATAVPVFSISGIVTASGSGLSDVQMNGLAGSVETNISGFYYGTAASGWTGNVIPALAGYTFTPAMRQYMNLSSDQVNQDYTAAADGSVLAISGTVTLSGAGLHCGNRKYLIKRRN